MVLFASGGVVAHTPRPECHEVDYV